eukprot:CAMPEP_0172606220 /NCGR_PEP_ID=MMETSP1068-20121228/26419_1 /TAXON_ID=35684 /ORGANISM="Pseudopedinella elastica, Strain CCMP716" /LENGTH=134 /DNA_ID=CAMNT_0013408879 /DNA_START=18 /DNA_END=422 /DNA_ORIENTATION=+
MSDVQEEQEEEPATVVGTPWSSRQRGVYVEMTDEEDQEDELATVVGTPWSSRQRGVYIELSDEQEEGPATVAGTPWSSRTHGDYDEVVSESPMRLATSFGAAHVKSKSVDGPDFMFLRDNLSTKSYSMDALRDC